LKGGPEKQAPVKIGCDSPVIIAGKPVTFSVKDALNTRWDLGDGTVCEGSTVTHIYDKSGFYRLAVTCDNNQQASMDFMNVFVCEDAPFITLSPGKATVSGDAAEYLVEVDKDWRITGGGSLKITAVGGRQHEIVMNTGSIAFGEGLTLTGYFRFLTDSEPDWNKEMTGPVVCLYQDKNNYITYKPSFKFLDMFSYNESRNNWVKFRLDEGFEKVVHGRVNTINEIKISLETVDKGYTRVYLDALCIVPEQVREPAFVSLSKPSEVSRYPRVLHNGIISGGDPLAPVLGNQKLYGDITPRIIFTRNGFYQAEFGTKRIIDRVDVWLYENRTRTLNSRNEKIPGMVSIECLVDGQWVTVLETGNLKRNKNEFKFSPVLAEAVRARFTGEEAMAIYGFKVYNTAALTDVSISASTPNELTVDRFEVKLRKEINGNGNPLGDLIARVYALNEKGELSECLFESIIPEKEVVPGGITVIRAQLKGLESNKKYALALGQTETAKSRTEGDYYRWVAGHAGYNETFGIYTGGVTKKSDYDWGTGWLKVICDITTVDYSHDSDHVGTRFGLADMQYRYMTFTMPASTVILTDGIAAPGPGFKFSGGTLEIDLKGRTASCLYLWLDREGILLVDGKPCEVRAGFNRIERKFSGRMLISPGDTTFTMYEVEVVSRDAI
ncbi:MAG: PKD domain-containing protein, partial [Clostridiaceae bacterium]|nr:PKD domain-containing protein [Clostridiaceae bacterium]